MSGTQGDLRYYQTGVPEGELAQAESQIILRGNPHTRICLKERPVSEYHNLAGRDGMFGSAFFVYDVDTRLFNKAFVGSDRGEVIFPSQRAFFSHDLRRIPKDQLERIIEMLRDRGGSSGSCTLDLYLSLGMEYAHFDGQVEMTERNGIETGISYITRVKHYTTNEDNQPEIMTQFLLDGSEIVKDGWRIPLPKRLNVYRPREKDRGYVFPEKDYGRIVFRLNPLTGAKKD